MLVISGGSWLVDEGGLCHMYSYGHGISLLYCQFEKTCVA
jgi:hypothetical protein